MAEDFSETTTAIAGKVPCDASLVRRYADLGLIEQRRLMNGMRVFQPSAAESIRKLRAERIARRGRHVRQPKA